MVFNLSPLLTISLVLLSFTLSHSDPSELQALLDLKFTLDPEDLYLSSWSMNNGGDPCEGSLEGVACNEMGHVANISLQGKGLTGKISSSIGGLKYLTGIYLHYNSLVGEVPKEIGSLSLLSDLYLNVNNLSGEIPPEIGDMDSLQVLQLCYNRFTGSIPTKLGSLKKLSVLALQSNQLTGAIPASLGNLATLTRLDLGFNHFFGSIPSTLANAPVLEVLDLRSNSLSGNVPSGLKKLKEGFLYENNLGLCGVEFSSLRICNVSDQIDTSIPESYGQTGMTRPRTRDIPETANLQLPCNQTQCSSLSHKSRSFVAVGVIVMAIAISVIGVLSFAQYRRRKQKLGGSLDISDSRLSTDQAGEVYKKNGSPLISLEYSRGWDPLADGRSFGRFSHEVLQSFRFNLDEVESATQYFLEANLLGRSKFSAVYKGFLRDGSMVAIKSISKSSCNSDEEEFVKGLSILTSLRHENLVKLRGFCCSRGRGECFLVYDFVPNGNLLNYLDLKDGDDKVIEWSTRVLLIQGIAKGVEYLHGNKANKPSLVHQNICAEKVLIDHRFNPLLSNSGLQKLLTNDIVFSALKASAAMGYLAPEYTTTGRFTEKSDVYAFGVLVLQILSGKRKITNSIQLGAESCQFLDFVDPNLHERYFEHEAAKLARIALKCTHECANQRPSMEIVVQEMSNFKNCI